MKFTLLVPVYNALDCVAGLLDSINNAGDLELLAEIIIGNDASDNVTSEYLRSATTVRLKLEQEQLARVVGWFDLGRIGREGR